MTRRNHSRRAQAPYGAQEIGYAEDVGGRTDFGNGHHQGEWDDMGEEEMGHRGGIPRMISDRPHTSMAMAFGVGFGLGMLVTLLLNREDESGFARYTPEAMHDLPDRFRDTRRRLSDSMSGSLRHVGEAVSSYVPRSWKPW